MSKLEQRAEEHVVSMQKQGRLHSTTSASYDAYIQGAKDERALASQLVEAAQSLADKCTYTIHDDKANALLVGLRNAIAKYHPEVSDE